LKGLGNPHAYYLRAICQAYGRASETEREWVVDEGLGNLRRLKVQSIPPGKLGGIEAEGRARDGGLRMGEMEVEVTWAHGILQFLKERIMECSDNYRLHTCKQCGMMANVNPEKNIFECRNCKNKTHFSEIRIPYACKLLLQEVQTMGIATRFITGN
jgi:hypothetical protein